MTQKKTYISIINAFWDIDTQETISAPATRVFFYILNRINRNHWEPVFISDYELAKATKASRRRLPDYRGEIQATGLIEFSTIGQGRNAGIVYQVPEEIAPKGTINSAQRNSLEELNSVKRSHLSEEIAPKGTINSAQRNSLEAPTPYNNISKTIKTVIEDDNVTRDARAREEVFIEEVEAEEVETPAAFLPATTKEKEKNCAQKEKEKSPAELMADRRKRAGEQGAQILEAFLNDRWGMERAAMSLHVGIEQLEPLAREVIDQWIGEGTCHDDYKGDFDYKDANRHLINTMRRKAADQASKPKSRQQARHDLMAASVQNLNRAMRGEGQAKPEAEAPF